MILLVLYSYMIPAQDQNSVEMTQDLLSPPPGNSKRYLESALVNLPFKGVFNKPVIYSHITNYLQIWLYKTISKGILIKWMCLLVSCELQSSQVWRIYSEVVISGLGHGPTSFDDIGYRPHFFLISAPVQKTFSPWSWSGFLKNK